MGIQVKTVENLFSRWANIRHNMKIKVCGMRDIENISDLYDAGIRMMGFIFYDKSKRFVSPEVRNSIFGGIHPDTKTVGVFVNAPESFVHEMIDKYHLIFVQLHGEESPDYCLKMQAHAKVIKAFSVDIDFDFDQVSEYQNCDYLLFDAKGKEYGGNGIQYDWSLLSNYTLETPFLLSGGLGPKDVDKILAFDHPKFAGVDVNSGFEIEAGLKDIEKIKSFISYLR